MSQLMDFTRYLAKEIGPRPTGTEEEQQAALYITEQFQKKAGFSAVLEEFTGSSKPMMPFTILSIVTIVVTLVAIFFSAFTIPAFVISIITTAIFVLEVLGRSIISPFFSRSASQNVVAKYQPNAEGESSGRAVSRKLILVAHYDTGHVTPSLIQRLDSGSLSIPVLALVGFGATVVLLLFRIFIAISGGGALVILNVLSVIALIFAALPIVKMLMVSSSPYNEGANNNATGSAALLEIAQRIASGSVSEADLISSAEEVTIHGEDAARSAGLVPEGAELTYSAPITGAPAEDDEEARLLAAKAAIAALTGKPVERRVFSSVGERSEREDRRGDDISESVELTQEEVVDDAPEPISPMDSIDEEVASAAEAWSVGTIQSDAVAEDAPDLVALPDEEVAAAPTARDVARAAATSDIQEQGEDIDGFQNAPSWFVSAQKKAKRSSNPPADVHRSRVAEAIEHAEQERVEQVQAQIEAERAEAEAKIRAREEEARAAIEAEQQRAEADRARKEAQAARRAEEAETDVPAAFATETESETEAVVADAEPSATEVVEEESSLSAETIAAPPVSFVDDASARHRQATKAPAARATNVPALDDQPISAPAVEATHAPEGDGGSRAERLRSLRTNVPSLSGIIRTKDEARKAAVKAVPDVRNMPSPIDDATRSPEPKAAGAGPLSSETIAMTQSEVEQVVEPAPKKTEPKGSTMTISSDGQITGTIGRIPDAGEIDYDMEIPNDFDPTFGDDFASNLVPDSDPDDAYGQQDDFEEARPRRSRARRSAAREPKQKGGFFSRFRKDHSAEDDLDESPQEWLGVDEDFDARAVGRARGSWESFREDYEEETSDPFADDGYDTFDDFSSEEESFGRRWRGGAGGRKQLGHVDTRSGYNVEADESIPDLPPEAEYKKFVTGEIERIYHFRNPAFNTEIWFVAIGCDNESHAGIRSFIDAHRSELRGSMVIDIESLGAGALSVASKEGILKKVSASSRIKRYTREAVAATGISLEEVDLSGSRSIASIVQEAGFQSMHLFGSENGRIALKDSPDDVMENLDELAFEENVNFVYELLKR